MLPPYYELTILKSRYLPADFPAVISKNIRTWKTIADRVNRLGNYLVSVGVRKGDRCAFIFYNQPEFIETCLAIQAIGAVPVPLNYRYVSKELEYVLNNCEANSLIFCSGVTSVVEEARKKLETVKKFICFRDSSNSDIPPWAEDYNKVISISDARPINVSVSYDTTAVIIYTGGTTGMPKGVVLTYGNIKANQEAIVAYLLSILPPYELKGKELSSIHRKMQSISSDMFTAVQKMFSSKDFEGRTIVVEIIQEMKEKPMTTLRFPPITIGKLGGKITLYSTEAKNPDMKLTVKIKESIVEFFALEIYSSSLKGRIKALSMTLNKMIKGEMRVNGPLSLKFALMKSNFSKSEKPQPNKLLILPPMFHLASFSLWLNHWNYPFGTILFSSSRSFNPSEVADIINRERPSSIFMVPTMWKMFMKSPDSKNFDTDSIKIALTGAAVMEADLKRLIISRFKNAILVDAFGQTEMAPATAIRIDADGFGVKSRSVGKPLPNVEVKIVGENGEILKEGEVGEIWYRAPSLMKEYFKDEEKTRSVIDKEGWFSSGDLGYIYEGEIYIVERKSECINTGGEKVYPLEVEEVIARHPKVAQVCVVGVPDEKWGETVGALVVLKDTQEKTQVSEEEIIKWCEKELAGYKKPRIVKFVDELPLSPVGKVLRKRAKEIMIELSVKGSPLTKS